MTASAGGTAGPSPGDGGVPPSKPGARRHASARERLAGLAIAASFAAVTAVAFGLRPAESGLGTHTQLGFPPCGLYERFGLPCLSCGWTTSWSAMAHLRPAEAFAASPFGALLWLLLAAAAAANVWSAVSGWSFFGFLGRIDHVRLGLAAVVLMIASWIYKIAACGRF